MVISRLSILMLDTRWCLHAAAEEEQQSLKGKGNGKYQG